jgi:hypothetical protein
MRTEASPGEQETLIRMRERVVQLEQELAEVRERVALLEAAIVERALGGVGKAIPNGKAILNGTTKEQDS